MLALTGCDSLLKKQECPPAPECADEKADCDCTDKPTITLGGGPKAKPDNGDLKLAFKEANSQELEPFAKALKAADIFEKTVAGLNDTIAFPRDWAVLMSECGRIDAYYEAKAPGVVLCYELMKHFRGLFADKLSGDELDKTVIGATFFAFLHEVGHALVDQLELPVTGKEEDAVDQLAAVILISSGGSGLNMALNGARAFLLHSKAGFSDNKFWDEHSFEEQRYYAIVCLAYGAAPKKYGALVGKGGLPKDRARGCPGEYARVKKAWSKLLEPYGK